MVVVHYNHSVPIWFRAGNAVPATVGGPPLTHRRSLLRLFNSLFARISMNVVRIMVVVIILLVVRIGRDGLSVVSVLPVPTEPETSLAEYANTTQHNTCRDSRSLFHFTHPIVLTNASFAVTVSVET